MKAANAVKIYRGAILWDMMGDKDLTITLSPDSPEQMTRDIFAAAEALNARAHFTYCELRHARRPDAAATRSASRRST